MKLTYVAVAMILGFSLMAGTCEQQSKRDPSIHEACLKIDNQESCEATETCEWKERSDGQFVCRAKSE